MEQNESVDYAAEAKKPFPLTSKDGDSQEYPQVEIPGKLNAQAEGFRLMKYVGHAEDGNQVLEWIWNSRNAVTPFIAVTEDGKVELKHVDWAADPYCPLHVPLVGDRVWVTLTLEEATKDRFEFVQSAWDQPVGTPLEEQYARKTTAVAEILEDNPGRRLEEVQQFVDSRWKTGILFSGQHISQEDAARRLAQEDVMEFGGQAPHLVVVDEELRDYFLRRALLLVEHFGAGFPVSQSVRQGFAPTTRMLGMPGTDPTRKKIARGECS